MDWSGKKVVITGAGGFIGSHLTERLVSLGAEVRAFIRYNSRNDRGLLSTLPEEIQSSLEICTGDLKDPEAVRRAIRGRETVFHLAALIAIPYSYVNPLDFVQTNVVGTANVLNACRDHGVSMLLHTSTSEVYGTAQYVPIDESHPLQPQSPYSASKISADSLAMSYFSAFALPVAIIRPFNTFGPRQSMRAVIPTIITQAMANARIKLGSLEPTRDFNYIDNTIDGFIKMAENDKCVGEIINIGSGREISIGDLVRMIAGILGREIDIVTDEIRLRPEKSEVFRLCAESGKARALVNWSPAISLEQGLRQTAAWIEATAPLKKASEYVV